MPLWSGTETERKMCVGIMVNSREYGARLVMPPIDPNPYK